MLLCPSQWLHLHDLICSLVQMRMSCATPNGFQLRTETPGPIFPRSQICQQNLMIRFFDVHLLKMTSRCLGLGEGFKQLACLLMITLRWSQWTKSCRVVRSIFYIPTFFNSQLWEVYLHHCSDKCVIIPSNWSIKCCCFTKSIQAEVSGNAWPPPTQNSKNPDPKTRHVLANQWIFRDY